MSEEEIEIDNWEDTYDGYESSSECARCSRDLNDSGTCDYCCGNPDCELCS